MKRNEQTDELIAEIRDLKREVAELRGERDATRKELSLTDQVTKLKEQIADLKIEKSQMDEAHERKTREVEHATGLFRKQSEWERDKAVDEARLAVREENLSAERERFEEQMDFHKEQIKVEIARFENLLTSLMERLPTVTIEKSVELIGSTAKAGTRRA